MQMDGKILGNRYELLEKIGGGGMAIVYKARCNLLNRLVAVKILRPEFVTDKEFIERFRVESQAAASLSHPNIVPIYDVGSESGINYIVMEYVVGKTLKEYIIENGPMPWKIALNIAVQICLGIEHAHKNHIVHRDIKPHNIIITDEMVAKVTDFGIARAVSSSTLTVTGNTIGSVHYFSPEQARGGYTDEKSDLYSLGIVLYEMLTGKVPFDAESPVSIALKHIDEDLIPPIELDNALPSSINDIVVKATRKKQAERYQSSSEMLSDMYSALKTPNDNFVKKVEPIDYEPTLRVKIPERIAKLSSDDENKKIINNGESELNMNKKEKNTVIAALATSFILILLISAGIAFYIYSKVSSKTVVVETPNIVGMQIGEAENALKEYDLTLKETERRYDPIYTRDTIISQDPVADMEIKSPGEIKVVVSNGQESVLVPDLLGMSYREAQNEIQKAGLQFSAINEPSAEMPPNYVVRQIPIKNTTVAKGSEVQVYISSGPDESKIKVPNLLGLSEANARVAIRDNKMVVGNISYSNNSNQSNGIVLNQSIPAGTEVSSLTKINLIVNNRTNTNSQTQGKSTRYITIDISEKGYNSTFVVKVEVDGDLGKRVAYEKVHSRSDGEIEIPITGKGNAFVRVFIDDKVDSEEVIDFDN